MTTLQEILLKDDVFAAVDYQNKDLLNSVKDAADKKFGSNRSYVKNLCILKEYKKLGGKVKYSVKRPGKDEIKKNVKKDVDRLRSQGRFEVDLNETYLTLALKKEHEFVNASDDSEVTSLQEDLETFEYCYEDDDFMRDFIETEAGEKKKNVKLNKPFRTPGGPKKFAVYVKNDKGNIVLVRFGDPKLSIKSDDPERKKSFRARHKCSEKKDRSSPGYWSCKFWGSKKVSDLVASERQVEENYKDIFDNAEEITEQEDI
jgi:hypothetical protein